jgi:transcriptional regulator GlxA family with amidase domain
MKILIYLFDGVTALDAVGPYESLQRLPECEICFVGNSRGVIRTGDKFLGLVSDRSIDEETSCDVLLVPGGDGAGLRAVLSNAEFMQWLRRVDAQTCWTGSICSGALLLAASGLLSGRKAATHWRVGAALKRFGAEYTTDRVHLDGKYLTAAGVSAGIDLGLTLCGLIAGEETGAAVELSMQHAPQPPFGSGDPATAKPELIKLVEQRLRSS